MHIEGVFQARLVLASTTVIAFDEARRMQLGTPTGETLAPGAVSDPELVRALLAFQAGATIDEATDTMSSREQPRFRALAKALVKIGVLVPESLRVAYTPSADVLREMAENVERIASDLAAFGPRAERIEGLSARIELLRTGLADVAGLLEDARATYLEEQVAKLSQREALKLHIGAGATEIPGFVDLDLFPSTVALDLRWGLPFADGAATHVYMAHVLEHFNYKTEALVILRELRRVLRPGGVLRVVVPDMERYFAAYVERDTAFFDAREATWGEAARKGEPLLARFLHYAGAGSWPGHLHGHKFGYDFATLAALLREAGFTSITRSAFMQSADLALRLDEASYAGSAKADDDAHYSLFVDASF